LKEKREKQIEEMAEIMCGNDCEECARESAEFYNQTIEEARNNHCLLKNCAKTLYNAGYRKIPKDARVFIPTEEQYIMLSREEYERITKGLVTEQRAKEIAQEYFGIVRKETAEKILERGKYCMPSGLREWIIETFDIEIKE
jgi:hypothetical protein